MQIQDNFQKDGDTPFGSQINENSYIENLQTSDYQPFQTGHNQHSPHSNAIGQDQKTEEGPGQVNIVDTTKTQATQRMHSTN